MLIETPHRIILEALDARTIQMTGSMGSVESRSLQVERMTKHVGEIMIAIILKEYDNKTKLLPK